MSFLPKGYTVPSSSDGYMKFGSGENVFRILDDPLIGYVYWKDKNPVRYKEYGDIPSEYRSDKNNLKHFWAFPVFDYKNKKVKILEITQKTIQIAIEDLVSNPKWGDPKLYDLNIKKEGDGMETRYSVMPEPKEEVSKKILDDYKAMNINLDALYDNGDPFDSNGKNSDDDEPSLDDVPLTF